MILTASEKAIINFYEWEYRGRGYYHFDDVVDIEPPFIPFRFKSYTETRIDDGKVPSLLQRIINIGKEEKKEEPEEKIEIIPNPLRSFSKLKGFSFSFSKGENISPFVSAEFLNLLSFTDESISFEIVGSYDTITVQFVCGMNDFERIWSHLKAFFPHVVIKDISVNELGFDREKPIAIADFGLDDEFMRPLNTTTSLSIDPLTSIIATLDNLHLGDTALFQILFKGVTAPWSRGILYSVSDGCGGSFFADSPEMLPCSKDKISAPLFSVVMRIGTQGNTDERSRFLASELSRSISSVSTSSYNKLIPLSNDGYNYEDHLYNLYNRKSNRLGMILNSSELVFFVHYPNKTIVSEKLYSLGSNTKLLPDECINQKYVFGINTHNQIEHRVSLNDTQRLKHCHIIGVTGVGKSTLLGNMILEDMKDGNACVFFDPHGDIIDDLLLRIPEHRINDVIVIDPSDTDFPIGFNLLEANTESEKIVLSSDLVSAFKRYATAWGDNMTAVLSNVINTFLESSRGGTLIELKRFLLEDEFRREFLKTVDDQSIHYYWNYEYVMVKKGIAPLLTRIDTFLRPKIIRYMLAQKQGLDFKTCIESKKILLIKLSQGQIGEENSYMLGSLFLSKLSQVIQGRQNISKDKRHPFYMYLDEFQNFITPSITTILSASRKYGLGIILAHQELGQIENSKILNSVISNPYTRICFRLGDNDARKLESGFSYFEQADLQNLSVGEALMRVGSRSNDFNLQTYLLPEINEETSKINKTFIIQNTRNNYAQAKDEIEVLIHSQLPQILKRKKQILKKKNKNKEEFQKQNTKSKELITEQISSPKIEDEKQTYLKLAKEREEITKHRSLQNYVRTMAHQRGFKVTIEEEIQDGGRVDVGLIKNDIKIAIEISVTNTNEYEVRNIQKCIDAEYSLIYMISESAIHLKNIQKRVKNVIDKKYLNQLFFFTPQELSSYLDVIDTKEEKRGERVKGWRVNVNFHRDDNKGVSKRSSISKKILNALKRNK